MSLLAADSVTVTFGGVVALAGVTFSVERNEIFAIVGPNGAGKSTLFNVISRFTEPDHGEIVFDGHRLLDHPPSAIAGLGIARTFQNIELFEHATVLQNLLIGRHTSRTASLVSQVLFLPAARREEIAHREAVEQVIDFLELQPYRDRMIAGLPYGVRKVVELGRALATGPGLVLLDEPASGLSAEETRDMRFWITDLRDRMGITVVMVEHDMGLVSAVSDRVLALSEGHAVAVGRPEDVQSHPQVIEAYLGGEAEAPT